MRALGAQGLQIVRRAAQTAELAAELPALEDGRELMRQEVERLDPTKATGAPKRTRKPRTTKARTAAPPVPVSTLPVFDREALRARLDIASSRPAPGTSELLSRPLQCETVPGHTRGHVFECHDLVAMAPIHLSREGFKP